MSAFKKLTVEDIAGTTQTKTSTQRAIRAKLIEQYPNVEIFLDEIMPKKSALFVAKCPERSSLLLLDGEAIFAADRENEYFPTLKVLHKYPDILPHQRVDKGAIPYIMGGANIMCPGLTHPNAVLVPAKVGDIVAIMCEGKEHAIAIGRMKMSSDDIKRVNKGIGVEVLHSLLDGLWQLPKYEK